MKQELLFIVKQLLDKMIPPLGVGGYTYSDFVLGLYGIPRENFESEQSFKDALNQTIFKSKNTICGGACGIPGDRYYYVGMDYLPEETRDLFLKAVNEGYEGKESLKFGSFGLSFFDCLISETVVSYYGEVRTPENFEKYGYSFRKRFEYWKDVHSNKLSLNAQEQEELALACEVYEKFLEYLGDAADKTILRDGDKSTIYPPNGAKSFQFSLTIHISYQLVYQMSQQNITKDEPLLELLNSKEHTPT